MKGPRDPDRLEAIRKLAAEGLSGGEIAARLGLTRNAVIGLAFRNKIELHGNAAIAKRREARLAQQRQTVRRPRPPSPAPTATPAPVILPPRGDPGQFALSGCKWICGDPRDAATQQCCHPIAPGSRSWCAGHQAKARIRIVSKAAAAERRPQRGSTQSPALAGWT